MWDFKNDRKRVRKVTPSKTNALIYEEDCCRLRMTSIFNQKLIVKENL